MKVGRLVIASALALLTEVGVAADAHWIEDSNGCKLWDPNPKPNETITWSGACREGYADGAGVLQWIVDGKPGSRHEGSFLGGKANGRGSDTFPSGFKIEGDYVDGAPFGRAIKTWPDGTRYEGELVAGARTGKGSQQYPDGSSYEGDWRDDKPLNPEAIKRKTYSLNTAVTGSHIPAPEVRNIQVPAYKTYAQLTPEEKSRVKNYYEKMPENDEPPYPLYGLEPILRIFEKFQRALLIQGELYLAVTVDSHGMATAVDVYKSPDARMTKALAAALMFEKYKPAVCGGTPCQMQFPFKMKFGVSM
jgi:hypothetical protein